MIQVWKIKMMEFSNTVEEGVNILKLSGDMIGDDKGLALLELVNDTIYKGVLKCIIDISDMRYINSSGIGVLITVLTKFRNKGGEVVLVNPSDSVKKLLIITKLNAIFSISASVDIAIRELKESK